MNLAIDEPIRNRYPGLSIPYSNISNVSVERDSEELRVLRASVLDRARSQHDLTTLKDSPVFRAYRDFFWRIGIDPTKIRPAGEALIRRVLRRTGIPSVNTLVDAYNLASVETGIAMAAFDTDQIRGSLLLRFSNPSEEFLGIGMNSPVTLKGGEVVIGDEVGILAIYPYRDAERSKIQFTTKSVVILACGVPGIDLDLLRRALSICIDYVTDFCGGVVESQHLA